MRHLRLVWRREPNRAALVRQVARGLSEGSICLSDINDLDERQIRALLSERTVVRGHLVSVRS